MTGGGGGGGGGSDIFWVCETLSGYGLVYLWVRDFEHNRYIFGVADEKI